MLETTHYWSPIIIAIYVPVSFITTYLIAVRNDHVAPGFPYISYTGTRSPESCVFSQLLNIGAVLGGIIIYIRYCQCLSYFEMRDSLRHLNTATFIAGMFAVFGISLVGNLQATNVITVHLFGAFLAFVISFVYMILQTMISYMSYGMTGNSQSDQPGATGNSQPDQSGATSNSQPDQSGAAGNSQPDQSGATGNSQPDIKGNSPSIRIFRLVLCVVDFILLLTCIL